MRGLRRLGRRLGPSLERDLGLPGAALLAGAVLVYLTLILVSNFAGLENRLWRYFGVDGLWPPFADLRNLLTGLDCTRLGYDVLEVNPCEPWDRPVNYPRVWLRLAGLGLGEIHTNLVGSAVAVAFALLTALFAAPRRRGELALWIFLVLSPSVMLAVERANIDLVIYLMLLTAALVAPAGRGLPALALLQAATFLKLFPVFALSTLALVRRRAAVVLFGVLVLVSGLYFYLIRDEIAQISSVLREQRGLYLSYGVHVAGHVAVRISEVLGRTIRDWWPALVFRPLSLAAVGAGFYYGRWRLPAPAPAAGPVPGRRTLAFAAGATVFAGTFLTGSNWDYRLVFLLLAVPMLVRIRRSADGPLRSLAGVTLAVLAASLWLGPWSRWYTLFVDEFCNWALLTLLAAHLGHLTRRHGWFADPRRALAAAPPAPA